MSTTSTKGTVRSIRDAADQMARGETTSVELTADALDVARRLDAEFHAFVRIDADRAMRAAELADSRRRTGGRGSPLLGIPIGLKDNITATGSLTSNGLATATPELERSRIDERLEHAGAVVLGKLALPEGAYTEHRADRPAPVNPWGRDLWTGTSSSGNGVAIASGMCFAAVGTDTGGSVRFPSACTGISGLRPSYGTISHRGVHALAPSLDQPGVMARSVEDVRFLFEATADGRALGSAKGVARDVLRVGIDRRWLGNQLSPRVMAAIDSVGAVLADAGCELVEVTVPSSATQAVQDWNDVCAFEAHATYSKLGLLDAIVASASDLGRMLKSGAQITAERYWAALARRVRFTTEFETLFDTTDVLLAPVLPFGVPTSIEMRSISPEQLDLLHRFTCIVPMAGTPSLTIPADVAPGPPSAVQLLGRRGADRLLLDLGERVQSVTDWHLRVPTLLEGLDG